MVGVLLVGHVLRLDVWPAQRRAYLKANRVFEAAPPITPFWRLHSGYTAPQEKNLATYSIARFP